MPQSGVQLKLDRSGGVTVFCGSTEIGQGSDSILAYVVAEVLGVDPFDIRVVTGDTDLTPVDLGSYSSRVTLMTGNAALQAAERARELLVEAAAAKLDGAEDSRSPRGGTRLRRRGPVARDVIRRRGRPGGVEVRDHRHGRLLLAPAVRRALPGSGRRAVAGVLVLRRGGGGRRRPLDRHLHGAQGLDRARRRKVHQPGPRRRPGGGIRLHGPGRGHDGGDGVPLGRQRQRRPQVPLSPGVQEPDDEGDRRRRDLPDRRPRPERPVRRERGRTGTAPAHSAGRRQRHVRRGRRPSRRDSRDSGEGARGPEARGAGEAGAGGADALSGRPVSGADAGAHAGGGRRRESRGRRGHRSRGSAVK